MCELHSTQVMEEEHFVRCLIQISDQYFDEQIMISLPRYQGHSFRKKVSGPTENKLLVQEDTNFESTLLQELMISGQRSVFVHGDADLEEISSRPSGYFIYLKSNVIDGLNKRLQSLKTFYFRNIKSRFVVVLDKKLDDPEKAVTRVLSKLWAFKIINVVVLLKLKTQDVLQTGIFQKGVKQVPDIRKSDNVIGIYTWFPYRDYRNCYNRKNPYLLDIWIMKGYGHLFLNNSLFPNKIKNSLNNCPIAVSTAKYHPFVGDPTYMITSGSIEVVYNKGWDMRLLGIIKDVMNVSVHFLPPPRDEQGRYLPNGSFSSIFNHLKHSKCDIAVAGLPLMMPLTDTGEHIGIYSRSEFVWLVPCARRLLGWRNIFRIFSSALWICVLLSLFLAACILHFLAKCTVSVTTAGIERRVDLSESSCNIFAAFLGTAVPSVPRTTTLRIFFFAWIGYSLAISTVVQSLLTSFLVKSDMEEQISSLAEVVNSGMDYGFLPQYDMLFVLDDTPYSKNILTKRKNCACQPCCLHRLANERDFAMLSNRVEYEHKVKYDFVDSDSWKILVCTIPEIFLGFYFTMYTPKGHQLLDRFNAVNSRIFEAGLYNEIVNFDVHLKRLNPEVHGEETHFDGFYQFSLKHLQMAFYIFMAGHLISLLVFLLEIMWWKFKHSA